MASKSGALAALAGLGQSRKAFWTLAVLVLGFVGYYATGLTGDPAHARTLATDFDRSIGFHPWWMFAYGGVYTAFLLPVFVVRCDRLFRRVALGFLFVAFVSEVVFAVFPVTTQGFRPDVASLDTTKLVEWGAALNFTCDPPMNCFPSLHVGTIVFAALVTWKADRPVGLFAFVLASLISLSTLLVKQHYVADVLGGVVVAAIGYAVCIRGYDSAGKTELEVRYSRWGVAGYVGTYFFAVFGVLVPMYLVGFKPWEPRRGAGSDDGIADMTSRVVAGADAR